MSIVLEPTAPVSAALNRLWTPRLSLSACVRGVMTRDTRGVALSAEQRFNYFPASPLCSISWWLDGCSERVLGPFPERPARLDDPRVPIEGRIVLAGPFNGPSVSWNTGPGHGMMLLLMPDALHLLTGLDPAAFLNRLVDASEVLPPEWHAMCEAIATEADDATRVRRLQDFLEPRWDAVRPKHALAGHRYHDWAQGLAMRAAQTSVGSSLRQLERRVKLWAGQPMRELQGISRLERAFFDAIAADGAGRLSWADVAADCGYADQSHFTRTTRRMTGFSPAELHRRIHEEEGFWAYRVWM
jgi:AraC-like DNA-binding protein